MTVAVAVKSNRMRLRHYSFKHSATVGVIVEINVETDIIVLVEILVLV